MSCATRSKKIPFELLAKKLKIKEKKAMEVIIKLACGDITAIKDLTYQNEKILSDEQYQLLEAIFVLIQETRLRRRFSTEIHPKKIMKVSKVIAKTILRKLKNKHKRRLNSENSNALNRSDSELNLSGGEKVEMGDLKHQLLDEDNEEENKEYDDSDLENNQRSDYSPPKNKIPLKKMKSTQQKLMEYIKMLILNKHNENKSILFSHGDTKYSNEILKNLKEKLKEDCWYTMDDLKRFP